MTRAKDARRGALQARLDTLEKTAERRLADLMRDGRAVYDAALKQLDGTAAASRLKTLSADGQDRLNELVSKTEAAGAGMLRHVERLQDVALQSMGFATRSQMAGLTRKVKRLVRKAGSLQRG
jgi:chemotaxis regulatin CheY-phosphate phosphatase CheZ